jgi:hypothetical protein
MRWPIRQFVWRSRRFCNRTSRPAFRAARLWYLSHFPVGHSQGISFSSLDNFSESTETIGNTGEKNWRSHNDQPLTHALARGWRFADNTIQSVSKPTSPRPDNARWNPAPKHNLRIHSHVPAFLDVCTKYPPALSHPDMRTCKLYPLMIPNSTYPINETRQLIAIITTYMANADIPLPFRVFMNHINIPRG